MKDDFGIGWLRLITRAGLDIGLAAASWNKSVQEAAKRKKPYKPPFLEMPKDYEEAEKASKTEEDIKGAIVAIPVFVVTVLGWLVFRDLGAGCLIGVVVLIALAFYVETKEKKPTDDGSKPLDYQSANVFTISLPHDEKWDAKRARRLVGQLLTNYGCLIFRIHATFERVTWQIVDIRTGADKEGVINTIHSVYPNASVTTEPFVRDSAPYPFVRAVVYGQPTYHIFPAPIPYVGDLGTDDPLLYFTQGINNLQQGEYVSFNVLVNGFAYGAHEQGKEFITVSTIDPLQYRSIGGAIQAESAKSAGMDKAGAYQQHLQSVMQNKLEQPLYHSLVLVEIGAANLERIGTIFTGVGHIFDLQKEALNGVTIAELSDDNFFKIEDQSQSETSDTFAIWEKWLLGKNQKWQDILFILDPSEIATLWHLPHEQFHASRIKRIEGKHVAMPLAMQLSDEGVRLGDNVARGKVQPVYLLEQDRNAHMIVVGKTRAGKSTLLHKLIEQDIHNGNGVVVIDPSPRDKSMIPRILQHSIPEDREHDVFVWDLSDFSYPPPLNLLRVPPKGDRQLAAERLMNVFEQVYGKAWGITRMAHTLTMCMHAILNDENPTIRDINRLYVDDNYRDRMTEDLESEAAADFWDRYENNMTIGDRKERFEAILHKLEEFYDNKVLYPVLCHPDGLDFGDYIQNQRIVLISLAAPEGMALKPADQALLGAVLVTLIQVAIKDKKSPIPFYLYIDEAEGFVTTSLPELLSEAAGLNLSLILANQYFDQLAGDTYNAVMGNIGAMVSFRVGDKDARILQGYMKPQFSDNDLMTLDDYHAAVFMKRKGSQQPAFCLHPQDMQLPNDPEQLAAATEREARIRQLSHERYIKKSREQVLQWLKERYPRRRSKGSESNPDEDTQPKKDIEDDFSDPESV